MNKIFYRIYPTILDAYFNYLNSDVIYERYYGKTSFGRSSFKN